MSQDYLNTKTYNRIAVDWDNDHAQDTWWHDGTTEFVARLSPGNLVLDTGCGSGLGSAYLIECGLRVVGIDVSPKLIALAERRAPTARFEVMNMRDVARLTERFDGVYAKASLLHIPRSEACGVLGGLVSVLKPNGLIYIAVKEAKAGKKLEEFKVENDYGYEYTRFFSYFTFADLEAYLNALGLKVVSKRVKRAGNTTWLEIVGQKP